MITSHSYDKIQTGKTHLVGDIAIYSYAAQPLSEICISTRITLCNINTQAFVSLSWSRWKQNPQTEPLGCAIQINVYFTLSVVALCPSIRHMPVLFANGCMHQAHVLPYMLPSTFPTLCWKGIWLSPKIRVLPSRTLSHSLDLFHNYTLWLSHVLSTQVDAESDKLATVIGHQFITLTHFVHNMMSSTSLGFVGGSWDLLLKSSD